MIIDQPLLVIGTITSVPNIFVGRVEIALILKTENTGVREAQSILCAWL